MRTAVEIYDAYRIMPELRLHQLRVGAVAKMVADASPEELDRHSVVAAALLHDMGNIIKFDLSRFPEFLEPEGREYWESVKKEFTEKYGASSHAASVAIAKEIGVSDTVVHLVDSISVSLLPEILERGSPEQKIVEYADDRVGPHGILPVRERFADMAIRYAGRYENAGEAKKQYERYVEIAEQIERQVLERAGMQAGSITDASVGPLIEELKHFQVG